MDRIKDGVVAKVGVVVRDAERASRSFAKLSGMKEAGIVPGGERYNADCRTIYDGRPSEAAEWLSACYDLGSIKLEFLQPVKGPSTWMEYLDRHGEGIHHIAWNIKGTDEVVEFFKEENIDVVQKIIFKGGECNYFRSEDKLGFIMEVVERG
jgi:methylmalonyl-CoA/ethylmalonyl-CoA epimerase